MSYGLDGEIWYLSSKPWPRLSNQFITFTWFLLNPCSYFGSNINTNRNTHTHLSSSRLVWIVQVDMWSLSRGDANLEGGTLSSMNASFITPYAQMYHNSKPWEDLEKSLFSSIFHDPLSDGIIVCCHVLVKNTGNLLVWFYSALWMFILCWFAFRQGLAALSHRVCFCPKSFISSRKIGL